MGLGPFQSRALVIASEAIPHFTEIASGGFAPRNGFAKALCAGFLKNFSANFPLLWALLVMVVIAGTGLALYSFWELVLGVVTRVFRSSARKR
jgi:hypothetical protein